MNFKTIADGWKMLGPGLIFAGAAVGVSHLVQSTRAGAGYGMELVWALIVANLTKYPFLETGPRYANATGKSLIEGYQSLGNWVLVLYLVFTIGTMFAIQAAVTIVTAGLFSSVFHLDWSPLAMSAIILILSMLILGFGKYPALDRVIKFIIVALALSTILAVLVALFNDAGTSSGNRIHFSWTEPKDILFLIAFIGWMPAPIDVSVWNSLWSLAKEEQLGKRPPLKRVLLDFNIGYIGAAFLGLCFIALGALVMYGSGEELSENGTIFATQLIRMYTTNIGHWAYPLIGIAALTTMFSTVITCLDAYPRVFQKVNEINGRSSGKAFLSDQSVYWLAIILLVTGTLALLGFLKSTMRFMVDLATTLSFVTAPVMAIINYKVITSKQVPADAQPKPWLKIFSWISIIFLTIFSVYFVLWKFII